MSSLLQHHGRTTEQPPSKRGCVELLMYLVHKELWYTSVVATERLPDRTIVEYRKRYRDVDSEPVRLVRPNGTETTCAKLYRVWRKPAGMWGCWVVFRYNGSEHVPDLSVPISVEKLPRDAEPLTTEEASQYWFTDHDAIKGDALKSAVQQANHG